MVLSENRIYKKINFCYKIFLFWKLFYSDFDKIFYDIVILVYYGLFFGMIIWYV